MMQINKTISALSNEIFINHQTEQLKPEIIPTKRAIISGFKKEYVHFKLKMSLVKTAIACYRNPLFWFKSLQYLIRLRRKYLSDNRIRKMVQFGNKYYMGLYTPGWNSKIYKTFVASQLSDFKPVTAINVNRFNTIFFGITKRCAYKCDHCYEWERLNKKDVLTSKNLKTILEKIQNLGVSQIHFSGGEPLMKINSLLYLLDCANKSKTEFWIDTSGHNLNSDNAKKLKKAGLTGIVVSLDHHIPEKHNAFRHFNDAYNWVEMAIKNANDNNLLTALSICFTKGYVAENNLMAYMNLAKYLDVSFVQFLEPKQVGHYKNKDIILQKEQIKILEDFFLEMNFGKKFKSYPIITYHGYYQRRHGCLSAGIKSIYIDTDGDLNACPFCHKKEGNILEELMNEKIDKLMSQGCLAYRNP